MEYRKHEALDERLLRQYQGMYDAQCELMQESFARMDQLLGREITRERELLEDEIAAERLEDWKVLSEEACDMEGEEIVFGSARFRRLIRRSNLVTIMSYFESSLSAVTSLLLAETNARRVGTAPGLRLEDFGHRNLCHKCQVVITKYIGMEVDQSLWDDLQKYVSIRNLIVHRGGIIAVAAENGDFVPMDASQRKLVSNFVSKGLSLLETGEMIVEPRMYESLLRTVRDYLCDILDRAASHFTAPRAVST